MLVSASIRKTSREKRPVSNVTGAGHVWPPRCRYQSDCHVTNLETARGRHLMYGPERRRWVGLYPRVLRYDRCGDCAVAVNGYNSTRERSTERQRRFSLCSRERSSRAARQKSSISADVFARSGASALGERARHPTWFERRSASFVITRALCALERQQKVVTRARRCCSARRP